MLTSKEVDWQVEGSIDDHEKLNSSSDKHVPERRVVHSFVATLQDTLDMYGFIDTHHQPKTTVL